MAVGNNLFQVLGEILIQSCSGIARFRQGNPFINGTAKAFHWSYDRDRSIILFHHDIGALPDLLQHGLNVSNQLGFRHVELRSYLRSYVFLTFIFQPLQS